MATVIAPSTQPLPTNPDDESIYNLIAEPVSSKKKQRRYRSKFPHDMPPTGSTFCATGQHFQANVAGEYISTQGNKANLVGTMPPKRSAKPTPKQFLRKGAKTSQPLPQPSRFRYADGRRKAPVVTRKEKPVIQRNKKNFIQQNAVEAITAAPKTQQTQSVDYMAKKDFGRVPDYLNEVKQEVQAEHEYINQLAESKRRQQEAKSGKRLLDESERQSLLSALKTKLAETNKSYAAMSHMIVVDSITKVRRKERLERELDELEQSIAKLSVPEVWISE